MKQTTCFLIIAVVLMGNPLLAQTAQNTDPSAALEVDSTTKGFLPPRMSTIQRNAISAPAVGLTIYNLDSNTLEIFTGSVWKQLNDGISGINTVISASGQIWLDRNLGADQLATSSTDSDAHGFLFQWGRKSDGHQKRTSYTGAGPVAVGNEYNNFITSSGTDWLSTPDDTRWNGDSKGTHDPCPVGFQIPTETELENERLLFSSNNASGAFNSALKLTLTGFRSKDDGEEKMNDTGYYWTSTADGDRSRHMYINVSTVDWGPQHRAHGFAVRCIRK